MWNHLVRFNGQAYEVEVPQPERRRQRPHRRWPPKASACRSIPYWDNEQDLAETYWRIKLTYTGPARRAGEALLIVDPLDIGTKDRRAWSYLPGQRRVKVAPDLAFDTPNPGTAGATPSTTPSSSTARWTASTSSWSARRR